tara:strand:+ start:118 stop:327 length:210 start_codon:yes stop_codon:yes gene_type:complete
MGIPVGDDEYVDKIIIDVCARKFLLRSSKGTSRKVECETTEQFMDVLEVVTNQANPDLIEYTDLAIVDS